MPRSQRLLLTGALGGLLLTVLSQTSLVRYFPLGYNTSPSLPIGLYRVHPTTLPTTAGEIARFCPSGPIATTLLERRWLPSGRCPSGSIPLGKYVVALPGDTVLYDGRVVQLSTGSLQAPSLYPEDFPARPWSGTLDRRSYWTYSPHPNSIDSRYFGPVDVADLRGLLRPLWTSTGPVPQLDAPGPTSPSHAPPVF